MANKIEQIANKQKQAATVKQNADVELFAKKVAQEILANTSLSKDNSEITQIISELSTAVAGAIVLSNEHIDEKLEGNFAKLLLAVKENKPDNATQVDMSRQVIEALNKLELSPTINLEALTAGQLKEELSVLLAQLPQDSKQLLTAYEGDPKRAITVRLSDGKEFYKAKGGSVVMGGGSSTTGGATEAKQDDIIAAIEGISGTVSYRTEIRKVGALTYIGNAALGSASSDGVWQIKRLDTTSGLTKKWADGNANFDNVWDNRESLSYS